MLSKSNVKRPGKTTLGDVSEHLTRPQGLLK